MMRSAKLIAALVMLMLPAAAVTAQVRTVDPNQAIDADLSRRPVQAAPDAAPDYRDEAAPAPTDERGDAASDQDDRRPARYPGDERADRRAQRRADRTVAADETFERDDLIGAGENVFGRGAQGFAGIIEKILKDQGRPNAYIAGREASGAFVVGLRYGSGVMTHKVEGQMNVYWTGPSLGFDVGGDANKVFVLVYNLYDTADLYKRFPQGEGHLYFVGGFSASYLRRGNVVLIPIRLGVGWRAGVNVGYMNFTRKSKWLPF